MLALHSEDEESAPALVASRGAEQVGEAKPLYCVRRASSAVAVGCMLLIVAIIGLFRVSSPAALSQQSGSSHLATTGLQEVAKEFLTSGGHIRLAEGNNMCLDVQGETMTHLQLWTCVDGNNNQQFSVVPSSAMETTGTVGHIQWMSNVKFPAQCLHIDDTTLAAEPGSSAGIVVVGDCKGAPTFSVPESHVGLIRWTQHPSKCLGASTSELNLAEGIRVWDCDESDPRMKFDLRSAPSYVLGLLRWQDNLCIAASPDGIGMEIANCANSMHTMFLIPAGGTGLLRLAANSRHCVHVVHGSSAQSSSSQLQLGDCMEGGHKDMLFRVPGSRSVGQIRMPNDGKCLSVANVPTNQGSAGSGLVVAACAADTVPQLFRPTATSVFNPMGAYTQEPALVRRSLDDGSAVQEKPPTHLFTIRQKSTGRFLTAGAVSETWTKSSRITTRPRAQNSGSQTWVMRTFSDGTCTIQGASSKLFLDAEAPDAVVTGQVEQGGSSQRWLLTPLGGQEYAIRQRGTMQFLDGLGESQSFSTATRARQSGDSDSQRWIITRLEVDAIES